MRKPIRQLVVDGRAFRWVLPGNALDHAELVHLTVFAEERGQELWIDPYAWELEIRPKTIAAAIRFALKNGWTPGTAGAPFRLGHRDGDFFVVAP